MAEPNDLAADLAQVRAITADLDGYIERRAQAIAESVIAAAKEAAQEHVDDARFEAQCQHDVAAELRRRLASLDRRSTAQGEALTRIAVATGHREPVMTPPAVLADEVEAALALLQPGEPGRPLTAAIAAVQAEYAAGRLDRLVALQRLVDAGCTEGAAEIHLQHAMLKRIRKREEAGRG